MASLDTRGLLTNEARRRRAESDATGKSYRVIGFSLGAAGHDPTDPSIALAPDPDQTECQSVVFGPKATSGFDQANDFCPVWECLVDFGEGVSLFSSVCLIAQIVYSPIPGDPEVGETFLYAIANLPRRPKLDTEPLTIRIAVAR